MPLYGFHCQDCNTNCELLVGMSDTPVCPKCGSQKLDRLMSRIAPEAKLKAAAKVWRKQAERQGDLSNFSKAERGT